MTIIVRANQCQHAGSHALYLGWAETVIEIMQARMGGLKMVRAEGKGLEMETNQICRGFHRLYRLIEGQDSDKYI